ncbi:MAG TPA: hypothetical protein ENK26_09955 [Gammaproteobacteria bacterium]|nr:hypothetical protein [Gammaproteobacteria bacterium]
MKIVRFFAPDSEAALAQVRKYLGEDAIVFSHKNIREGVEILAAAKAPGDAEARPSRDSRSRAADREGARIRLHAHLQKLGLGDELAGQLAYRTDSISLSTPATAIRDAHAELARMLPVLSDELIAPGKIIAMIGPVSAGKTSTLAKMARLAREREDIAAIRFVSLEALPPEEIADLREMLDDAKVVLETGADIADLTKPAWNELVLVDTPALTQQELRAPRKLAIAQTTQPIDCCLVLPATLPRRTLERLAASLSGALPRQSCVITKVDSVDSIGPVLATVIRHRLPVAMWSDGGATHSHLYRAQAKHLVEKALAIHRVKAFRQQTKGHESPRVLN